MAPRIGDIHRRLIQHSARGRPDRPAGGSAPPFETLDGWRGAPIVIGVGPRLSRTIRQAIAETLPLETFEEFRRTYEDSAGQGSLSFQDA
jgi:hypothetical protein